MIGSEVRASVPRLLDDTFGGLDLSGAQGMRPRRHV